LQIGISHLRTSRNQSNRKYRVLPIALATGESLPTLVRSSDWLPLRLATRWAVRRRRFECMSSTLDHAGLGSSLRVGGILAQQGSRRHARGFRDSDSTRARHVGHIHKTLSSQGSELSQIKLRPSVVFSVGQPIQQTKAAPFESRSRRSQKRGALLWRCFDL
jgi:hypothetical protein